MSTDYTETVKTPHGQLAVRIVGSGSPSILCIHGNSQSSRVFQHILSGSLAARHRIVAFDLPGHGASSDAPSPETDYTQAAYAQAAVALLKHLEIESVIVFGWSLGGHVGIEMIQPCEQAGIKLQGLMITGTPPFPLGKPEAGFKGDLHMAIAFKDILTDQEKVLFAHTTGCDPYEEWMKDNVYRTDGRARHFMYQAMANGTGVDQQHVVSTSDVLLAVVNGADEPYVKLDFVRSIPYRNLWRGSCIELPGLGHAPFWEDRAVFDPIFEQFVNDASRE